MRGHRKHLARKVWSESPKEISFEELAQRAETTVEAVRQYSEMGLLGEEGQVGRFGEGTLFLVRRIEQLRVEYGVPATGAGLVLDLAARVEELEEEIRSLREAMRR
ncbi:MAG: hypothetical protein EBZ44_00920 [Verrucomicrobia bacterium]|nr:hypothetical protein [bacterium]NDA09485.1 hypothetical protein [Verrucomicrobiota bacterium]NDA25823.1 hypothetical protein [Verrucomicrobiota bacterium]NDD56281.1 hypothetical protein [Verrucomicrobiota bacterium]NDD80972.1 hypothetical protein [Verrucomicrobiota bacterium]